MGEGKDKQIIDREKKLYFLCATIFGGLFLMTIIFSRLFSPLKILQIRLFILAIWLVFILANHFIHQYFLSKKREKEKERRKEIIIIFNGKELG